MSRSSSITPQSMSIQPLTAPTLYSTLDDFLNTLTSPVWNNAGHTAIMLQGTYNGSAMPFLASASDPEAHGVTVYNNAVAGAYGTIGPYVAPGNPTKNELNNYASNKVITVSNKARNYVESGVGTVVCAVGVDAVSLNQLHIWGVNNATATTTWADDNYNTWTFTGAQAVTFWNDTNAYQQSVNGTLTTVLNEIASGTITTYAQIDSAPWPT